MPVTTDRPKRAKGTKPATEVARQLFLYGEGDGVRILDATQLAAKSGVCVATIRNRMPEWLGEFEERLASSTKLASPNILSLPEETLDKHRDQTQFILKRMEEVMAEIDNLAETISKLESLVDIIAQQAEKPDQVIALFDRYLRLCMNRKSLIRLFTDLKRLWDEKVGLDSLKSIQEATAKSASIAALKANEPSPQESGVVPAGSGVFQRSK